MLTNWRPCDDKDHAECSAPPTTDSSKFWLLKRIFNPDAFVVGDLYVLSSSNSEKKLNVFLKEIQPDKLIVTYVEPVDFTDKITTGSITETAITVHDIETGVILKNARTGEIVRI